MTARGTASRRAAAETEATRGRLVAATRTGAAGTVTAGADGRVMAGSGAVPGGPRTERKGGSDPGVRLGRRSGNADRISPERSRPVGRRRSA